MSSFATQTFDTALNIELAAQLPAAFGDKLCVAFSGGVDSAALLHALVRLRAANPSWRIRAIHVDHQLQSVSGAWAEHCLRVAEQLGIELTVERVTIARDDPQGLESAARTARYAVFRRLLQAGEVLVTAHHADDQAETLLLALMRGSGVRGLAAMPAIKAFGQGWHSRPLLGCTRAVILAWSREQGINAIDDPSNVLLRHDRNYLRHEVLPQLQRRWPTTATSIARSASHLGEALGLLEDIAIADLQECAVKRALRIDALRGLSPARRRNLLRYWLRGNGLPLPSTRKLIGLERDMFNADPDRMPRTTWPGAELRWHRGLLYVTPATPDRGAGCEQPNDDFHWLWSDFLPLPNALGRLALVPTLGPGLAAARLPATLNVRFRRGGEKIRLTGRQHRHALRNLLQESDVLPWWRDSLPLIFVGKQLIAVGDLFFADDFAAAPGEVALQVVWEGAPEWKAVKRDA